VKESDRIAAVVRNLDALGVRADETEDGFRIVGGRTALQGKVRAHSDHRIAMSFGVLGALRGSRIQIDDPSCVGVSYPEFWSHLERAVQ
jgi:3-phosphoshikimate 1-carboxyvinyltransferase